MSKKPLALLLSPVLPQPGASGRALRTWGWLQELQRDYRVHVLLTGDDHECVSVTADYPAESVMAIGAATAPVGRWQRLLALLFPLVGLYKRGGVVDWLDCLPDALHRLTVSLESQPVQRIVVFRLYLHDFAQAFAARFPEARLDLDMDDLESSTRLSVAGAMLRMGRYRQAIRTTASALQYRLLESYMAGPYQTLYLAAPDDCARISTRLAQAVECRPNTVAAPQDFKAVLQGDEVRLLFIGTLNYPPNEEAVRDILRDLLPALGKSGVRCKMSIVGRHASPRLERLLREAAQVEFLSNVDDLAACYAQAQIVLVPMRAGGGTKLKTLEAFAHRRPVVSTPQGVRGLDAVAGQHYLPALDAGQFAEAILRLARDPALVERIADAGWSLWHARFRQS